MVLKKTSYSREVRPFQQDLSAALVAVRYRYGAEEPWQDVREGGVRVLPVSDLRREAIHQVQVEIGRALLDAALNGEGGLVRFVVLTRDAASRRVILLANHAVADLPDVLTLDVEALRASSLEAQIKIEARLVLPQQRQARIGEPHRKGTWLAQVVWTVSRDAIGPGFRYERKTAADFLEAKLPPDTCWWVKLDDTEPEALIEDTNDPGDLFEVWVHEDVWPALQEVGPTAAGEAVGMQLLGAIVSTLLRHASQAEAKATLQPSSIVARLAAWIAQHTNADADELIERVRERRPQDVEPFLQSALGLGRTLKAIDFRRT